MNLLEWSYHGWVSVYSELRRATYLRNALVLLAWQTESKVPFSRDQCLAGDTTSGLCAEDLVFRAGGLKTLPNLPLFYGIPGVFAMLSVTSY